MGKPSTYNIELEYSLFNNKLVGNFSYYYRHTTDAFMSKTVSRINGVSSYTVNQGTLNNQGFEFDINFTPIENLGAGGEKARFRVAYKSRISVLYLISWWIK